VVSSLSVPSDYTRPKRPTNEHRALHRSCPLSNTTSKKHNTNSASRSCLKMLLRFALLLLGAFTTLGTAQFQFFEQMFQGQHQQQQQQHQEPQNVASDSTWYQQTYESGIYPLFSSLSLFYKLPLQRLTADLAHVAHCTNYLCPETLACVHFPHHCPCAFPAVEDKLELGDGSKVCVSKGGYKAGEAARKIELARKGVL